jgi:hypothetical protein
VVAAGAPRSHSVEPTLSRQAAAVAEVPAIVAADRLAMVADSRAAAAVHIKVEEELNPPAGLGIIRLEEQPTPEPNIKGARPRQAAAAAADIMAEAPPPMATAGAAAVAAIMAEAWVSRLQTARLP